jgi:hypothetical protein
MIIDVLFYATPNTIWKAAGNSLELVKFYLDPTSMGTRKQNICTSCHHHPLPHSPRLYEPWWGILSGNAWFSARNVKNLVVPLH